MSQSKVSDVGPGAGPFALYLLEKKGWTTPDGAGRGAAPLGIELRRLSYGGLKDRHAHTLQYFRTIAAARKLNHSGVQVTYLGQTSEPYTSQQMAPTVSTWSSAV